MMASAWYQGKSAAVACDALGETGKGMVNYLVSQKRLVLTSRVGERTSNKGIFLMCI